MRNLDVLVVRFLPFVIFAIIGNEIVCSLLLIELDEFYLLHGNSAIYASGLYAISYSNKRFHCRYNRYMLLFLIFTPLINYLEAKFFIFPSEHFYLSFVISLYATTMVITSYLAIDHFRLAIKRRKLNNKWNGSGSTNFETTREHE
jgi:NADH:ubiquinone oxidoreductase subunit 3 (subunit A)